MTTIQDLINNINFDDKKIQTDPNWEDLSEVFNLQLYYSDDTRLKAYHVKVWCCTDTWVPCGNY